MLTLTFVLYQRHQTCAVNLGFINAQISKALTLGHMFFTCYITH